MDNSTPADIKKAIKTIRNWMLIYAIIILSLMFLFMLQNIAKLFAAQTHYYLINESMVNIIMSFLSILCNIILIVNAKAYSAFLKSGQAKEFNQSLKNDYIYWLVSTLSLFITIILNIIFK